MILVGESQLSHGEILNCAFSNDDYNILGSLYQCEVTTLDNTHNNLIITGHTGTHMAKENNNNVKAIYIHDTNTKYVPKNLGLLFNLTALAMWNGKLVEIKSTDFHGMQDLIYISFRANQLTSVPSDVFDTLTKLRTISLDVNQIEELPIDLFSKNLNVEEIFIRNNKIKFIATGFLNGLTQLNKVELIDNICVSKNYEGTTAIIQLKEDIQMKCWNPN